MLAHVYVAGLVRHFTEPSFFPGFSKPYSFLLYLNTGVKFGKLDLKLKIRTGMEA